MKKLAHFLFLVLLISSCSKNDETQTPEQVDSIFFTSNGEQSIEFEGIDEKFTYNIQAEFNMVNNTYNQAVKYEGEFSKSDENENPIPGQDSVFVAVIEKQIKLSSLRQNDDLSFAIEWETGSPFDEIIKDPANECYTYAVYQKELESSASIPQGIKYDDQVQNYYVEIPIPFPYRQKEHQYKYIKIYAQDGNIGGCGTM